MLARTYLLAQNARMASLKMQKKTTHRQWRICLTLWILAWLAVTPLHAEECVKMVFNTYCLGGDTAENLAHLASPPPAREEAGRQYYEFDDGGKTHRLISRDGRTVAVTRHETPGGWINFTAWKTRLVRLYGRGEDLSDFPRYAASRSSRLNAINAGRGHAEFRWSEAGYTIRLVWDNPDYIALRYELDDKPAPAPGNTDGL
ncbi:hypothetical protein Q4485_14890 [Granulosicoccaceae sp. 1_MG-2023]|nr:hypothetical protein [Granulosicoccaceae sp. 1_MG-2023]